MRASPDANPGPPPARREPITHTRFGVRWTDDYAWLRDPGWPDVRDPEILDHLRAENAWFERAMEPHRPLVAKLHEELKARIAPDEASVPVREGIYEYGWRFRAGQEYRVWERRPAGVEGPAEVLLDENLLAGESSYFALRSLSLSPDGRLLAWATDEDGSERYRLHVEDLATRRRLSDLVGNTSGSLVWAEDGRTLVYVELDPALRPWRVRAHRLGSDPSDDAVLFADADPAFFVSIAKTLDRRFLLITSGTHETREIHLIDARQPLSAARLVAPRRPGHRYNVDHAHGRLWIRTNDRHPNFRLVSADPSASDEAGWQEVIAADDDIYLQEHTCFAGFMLLRGRQRGRAFIRLRDWLGAVHEIAFPESACAPLLGDNREFATDRVRLAYSSMVTPPTIYDYVVAERRLVTRKVQQIPTGYEPSAYVSERLTARAPDGTEVPITLLRRRDVPPGGPLLLYGYGAYGHGLEASFAHTRLSLVDRGITFALAHVRGGDELGPRWWEAGRGVHKVHSFTDFIACAEALIAQGHTRAGQIAIRGGSAGGLLIGAVLNLRPELWRCAVAEVPFVDVLNTILDPSLPLTPIEWPEWGNPLEDEAAFRSILSYSPYENVRAQAYPDLLVTAGLSDPRVGYWEPAKWVARLRATKTDTNLLLLRTHMEAGHFGRSGRYEALRDLAEQYAFVLMSLQRSS